MNCWRAYWNKAKKDKTEALIKDPTTGKLVAATPLEGPGAAAGDASGASVAASAALMEAAPTRTTQVWKTMNVCFGGLTHDDFGGWIVGYRGYLGCTSNIHAKMGPIYYGRALAWQKEIHFHQVTADCMDIIHLIYSTKQSTHKYGIIINDNKALINRDWKVE
ncbi:hypothetical protein L6164_012111 [Bauhinia variegata]|uniref:Uncharacterized protein n=1 Tax=Bauhinia variegata TaxID=167791 RepID=A0ACB9PAK6_BAUVA|nr:hypothetical protein L6164_012111 [Bauhinia variegata]